VKKGLFALISSVIILLLIYLLIFPLIQKQEKENLIQVENIVRGQLVQSPVVLKGKARGYWYFEASFPIRIYDGNGDELGVTIAQAQEEWMTENFVPFEATLQFKTPKTKQGFLVLEKDNPSGLPENADELRIPITFN